MQEYLYNMCIYIHSLLNDFYLHGFWKAIDIALICAQGCDGSILLASPNNKAEKNHPDDNSLAGDGFDTVAKAKAAVDSEPQCRNKVSCADILALATRDVINLVYNFYIAFLLGVYS